MKRVNLIPGKDKNNKMAPVFFLGKVVLCFLIPIIMLLIWQTVMIKGYEGRIALLEKKIKTKKNEQKKAVMAYEKLEAQRKEAGQERLVWEERKKFLEDAQREGLAWSKVLLHVSALVPKDVWLGKISLNKDTLILTGSAPGNSIVSDFMEYLDASSSFRDTNFSYMKKSESTLSPVVDFEVNNKLRLELFR